MFEFAESDEFEIRENDLTEMFTLPTIKGYELENFEMDELQF